MRADAYHALVLGPRRRTALGYTPLFHATAYAAGMLGDDITSNLAAITSDPSNPTAAKAWNGVLSQVNAEGGSVYAAQTAFVTQYNSLVSTQLGVDPASAAQAAANFVLAGQTVLGAVSTIGGIIQAGANGITPALVQGVAQVFTGTMIATLVAAGAVVPGLGSAIVLGVGLILQVMAQVGLFGKTPSGTSICSADSSFLVNPAPVFVIGCVAPTGCASANTPNASQSTGAPCQVQPGSSLWRPFPDPTNPADAVWFQVSGSGSFTWQGLTWVSPGAQPGGLANFTGAWPRPIDWAFPSYRQLECEAAWAATGTDQVSQALQAFRAAYFSAWKMNKAYAFNGLQPTDDALVLLHLLLLWNRAHLAGTGTMITPSTTAPVGTSSALACPQPGSPFYAQMIAASAIANVGSVSEYTSLIQGGGLQLNTGAQKVVTATEQAAAILSGSASAANQAAGAGAGFSLLTPAQQAASIAAAAATPPGNPVAPTAASSTAETVLVVLGVLAAAAVGGTYIYGRTHHMTFAETTSAAWRKLKKPFKGKHRASRGRR